MVKDKLVIISFTVFSFLMLLFMESCYLFCFFKSKNEIEDAIEHLVEEAISAELSENDFLDYQEDHDFEKDQSDPFNLSAIASTTH
jgi:hypothetical protein